MVDATRSLDVYAQQEEHRVGGCMVQVAAVVAVGSSA